VARVYLDEDVSILLASLLQSRRIFATTARDNQMLRKTDGQHLEKAIQLSCIMVTHNRGDFERLYTEYITQNKPHQGIIVLSRKRDIYTSAQRLVRFFSAHPNIANQLWYL
jgi:predicted nuclease of predicted toxin-antitoxin system